MRPPSPLKITALELTPVRTHREMGRRAPSDPEPAESRHVVVQLHTDAGVTGLGEMSDVPWELNAASTARLQAALEPLLDGADAGRRGPLLEELSRRPWEHQVVCGIDMAVHDAVARKLGVSLAALLGGAFRDRVPFAYPLAPCRDEADVAANLDRIERRLGQGALRLPLLLRHRPGAGREPPRPRPLPLGRQPEADRPRRQRPVLARRGRGRAEATGAIRPGRLRVPCARPAQRAGGGLPRGQERDRRADLRAHGRRSLGPADGPVRGRGRLQHRTRVRRHRALPAAPSPWPASSV